MSFSVLLVAMLEDAVWSRLQRGKGGDRFAKPTESGPKSGIADPLLEAKLGGQSKFAGLHSWKKK